MSEPRPPGKEPLSVAFREKIANRNSWLKIGVVSAFSVVLGIKIAGNPVNIDLSEFKFSDLLSLLLALFSVGLSVVFYLKATDTSNEFYHHSYTFTKDISMILGRIEASFGERLKHLDEGYTGLRGLIEEKGDRQPTTALVRDVGPTGPTVDAKRDK